MKQQQEQFKQQQKINDECLKTIKNNDKTINQRKILFIVSALVLCFVPWLMADMALSNMSVFMGMFALLIMPCFGFVIILWCWCLGDKDRKNIDIFKNNNEFKKAEQLSTEYKKKMIPLLTRWGLILNIIAAVFLALILTYLPIKYNKAVNLYKNREYGAAAKAFYEMGDYKDSISMREKCKVNIQND